MGKNCGFFTNGHFLSQCHCFRLYVCTEVFFSLSSFDYILGERQNGVYNAKMFYKNDKKDSADSVHVILLDGRSGRDPTYLTYGSCHGADSKMLIDEQWNWLDAGYSKFLCGIFMHRLLGIFNDCYQNLSKRL